MKSLTVWQPYLAGVLHGDGWCTQKTLGLRVKDRDFAEAFAEGVRHVFGVTLEPKPDERGYWLVRASNRTGRFDGLREYEPTDNDELGSWVRGLFDSEGNAQLWLNEAAGPASYHRRVAMYSTNIETLQRAAKFLAWLDVSCSIRPTKNSSSHKGTKTVHELRVVRQNGFARFLEMVGSSIQRKQRTLIAISGSYQAPGWQARNWSKAVAARWGAQ